MTVESEFKTVPHNIEAEQALLGALMFDNGAWAHVEGAVRAIQFYEPFHQRLFVAIEDMCRSGRMADPVTLVERFKADQAFHDLGGIRYFADLVDRAPPAYCAADYGRVIADDDTRRRLIGTADGLRRAAMQSPDAPDTILSAAEWQLGEIARGTSSSDQWKDGNILFSAVSGILDGTAKPSYVPTGIASFDAQIGGLVNGRCNYLVARPSMGKSAVATVIAWLMAGAGLGVGMYSLEMDQGELGARLACAAAYRRGESDNPMYFLANKGELSDAARQAMAWGASSLRDLPLSFDDRPGLKPSQIGPAAKRLIRTWQKKGIAPGAIIVDHLHIVHPDEKSGNRVVDVAEVSGFFRDLARETGVAFLILCQMSREVDSRKVADKRPQLSDIRWAGEIEQDAAQITFLLRPEKYLREPEKGCDDYDAKFIDWDIQRERWRDRILFLNEKNRGGPTQIEVECGISLGCNALWEIEA